MFAACCFVLFVVCCLMFGACGVLIMCNCVVIVVVVIVRLLVVACCCVLFVLHASHYIYVLFSVLVCILYLFGARCLWFVACCVMVVDWSLSVAC